MINLSNASFLKSLLFNLIDVVTIIVPVLLAVAFMTIIERKQLAAHQRRVGPVKCFGKTLLREKPSNSGDALKLLIPSYSRKAISGQNNYLGMVTSQEMIENEMGYRGSKSEFIMQYPQPKIKINSVKEQRVDGGYLGSIISPKLRCTLMGCENNYQIKIPSNQINIKKNYYSSAAYAGNNSYSSASATTLSLNPYFITGFSDAEASFIILILKEPKNKTKWTVKTSSFSNPSVYIKKIHKY